MDQAEDQISRLQQRLADLLAHSDAVIWEFDPASSQFVYVTEGVEQLVGYPPERWLSLNFFRRNIIHQDDLGSTVRLFEQVMQNGYSQRHEYRVRAANGETLWVEEVVHAERNTEGRIVLLRGVIHDSDEKNRLKSQLLRISTQDELTGLPNRSTLENRLKQAIINAQRSNNQLALMFLDMDGFHDINNSLGHEVGDQLLQTIADRLGSLLRSSDMAARFSGDSFCILLENLQDDYLPAKMAERCLKSLTQPVQLNDARIYPQVSIGIALHPRDGDTVDTLMRAADSAKTAAKEEGRHSYAFYTPEMTDRAHKRLHLENDLRKAIGNNEMVLYYQPQVSLLAGTLEGVEALIRWNHPTKGLLGPDEFIPLAEKNGLIIPLGDWVIRTACQQIELWKNQKVPVPKIAINLSSTHFCDPTLLYTLQEHMQRHGVSNRELVIEITEAVTQSDDRSRGNFERLKQAGFGIAIDDFGTGYSCLSSLTRLPIDCLKIDRTFVQNALNDPRDATLVATIMSMGRTLGFNVVAEGVETRQQVEYLHGIGCDTAQGYYFSRPVEADRIPPLANENFFLRSQQP